MALRHRFRLDRRMRDPATMTLLVVQSAGLGALLGTALWAALYIAISLPPMEFGSAWRIFQDFIVMHWIEGLSRAPSRVSRGMSWGFRVMPPGSPGSCCSGSDF